MRVTLIAAALLAATLVVLAEAMHENPLHVHKKAKAFLGKAHKHTEHVPKAIKRRARLDKAEQKREMQAQQQQGGNNGGSSGGNNGGSSGGNNNDNNNGREWIADPDCYSGNSSFGLAMQRVDEQCEDVSIDFLFRNWYSKNRANEAFRRFCTSPCAGTISAFNALPNTAKCVDPQTSQGVRMLAAMCQKSTQTGFYCGAEFQTNHLFQTAECERGSQRYNRTRCAEYPECHWNGNNQWGYCELTPNDSMLNEVCDDCNQKIATAIGEPDSLLLCKKIDNRFCVTAMFNASRPFMNQDRFNPNATTLNRFCGANSHVHRCMMLFSAVESADRAAEADENLYECLSNVQRYPRWYSEESCLRSYIQSNEQAYREFEEQQNMCATGGDGQYCGIYSTQESQTIPGIPCAMIVLGTGVCNSTCDARVNTLAGNMGCCLNLLQQKPYIPIRPAEIPYDVNTTLLAQINTERRMQTSGQGPNLLGLFNCTSAATNLERGLTSMCIGNGTASSQQTINTRINSTVYSALNDTVKGAILRAIVKDVSAVLGVPPAAINTYRLVSDVTTGYLNFVFTIWANSQVLTDIALSELDLAKQYGTFKTDAVNVVLMRTCRRCTAGGLSALPVAAPPTFSEAPVDLCVNQQFYGAMINAINLCENETETAVFENDYNTMASANRAWNTFCNGRCFNAVRAIRGGRYGSCLPPEFETVVAIAAASCELDVNGTRCGASQAVLENVDCASRRNETYCISDNLCGWTSRTNECFDSPTAAFLEPVCNGGCITKFAAALASLDGSIGRQAQAMDQILCSRDGDTLCLPHITNEVTELEVEGFTTTATDALCGTPSKGRCARRVWLGESALILRSAEDNFIWCFEQNVEPQLDSYGGDEDIAAYYLFQCIVQLDEDIYIGQLMQELASAICLTNNNGVNCMTYFDQVFSIGSNQCDAATTLTATMGCCAGTFQNVFGNTPVAFLDEDLIPEPTNDQLEFPDDEGVPTPSMSPFTAAPTTAVTMAPTTAAPALTLGENETEITFVKSGMLAEVYNCPTVYQRLRVGCKKARAGTPVNRTLPVGVAWSVLQADPRKARRMLDKLITDLANKLGLSKDDFITARLVENPDVTVAVSSSGRRMSTQQTSSSGTRLRFSAQGSNAADTAAAGSQFDAAVNSNTLSLPSTTRSVAKECSNCTSGGASAIQSSASVPSVPTGALSGASAASVLLTLAVIAMSLF